MLSDIPACHQDAAPHWRHLAYEASWSGNWWPNVRRCFTAGKGTWGEWMLADIHAAKGLKCLFLDSPFPSTRLVWETRSERKIWWKNSVGRSCRTWLGQWGKSARRQVVGHLVLQPVSTGWMGTPGSLCAEVGWAPGLIKNLLNHSHHSFALQQKLNPCARWRLKFLLNVCGSLEF